MYVNEEFRTRILLAPQTTAVASGGYVAPTPGVNAITIRAVVNIGNAADLALTLQSADDTSGNNPINFVDVPIYIGGVRQTADGHSYTVTADSGNFIIDFDILPSLIPQGKTIGLSFGVSNAANLISAEILEDTAYDPTPTVIS